MRSPPPPLHGSFGRKRGSTRCPSLRAAPLGYDLAGDPEPVRARFPVGTERIVVWPFVVDAPAAWEPTLDHEHVDARWLDHDAAIALLRYPEPKEIVRRAAE